MYEKYNVETCGAPGAGGEYNVQTGFGWTNGVALELLAQFGDALVAPPLPSSGSNPVKVGLIVGSVLGAVFVVFAIGLVYYRQRTASVSDLCMCASGVSVIVSLLCVYVCAYASLLLLSPSFPSLVLCVFLSVLCF